MGNDLVGRPSPIELHSMARPLFKHFLLNNRKIKKIQNVFTIRDVIVVRVVVGPDVLPPKHFRFKAVFGTDHATRQKTIFCKMTKIWTD